MPAYRMKKRGEPAACPFCEQRVPRPAPPKQSYASCHGGRCSCGAFYLLDATGREGGAVLLEGLLLLAEGDSTLAMKLQGGTDYQLAGLGYDARMHVLEPQLRGRAFGRPKLWFFKLSCPASSG